jgi:pimeloyl-ACP methyl ester carboxylesterase
MERVDSRGVSLAVEVVGDGEPVTVVSHGLSGSRADLAILAPFLPGTKVLFDFRGHGDSDRPPAGAYTMDDFAADVDAVATAYGATAAAGASLGSGAMARLLTRHPDRFERLIFLFPARLEHLSEARAKLIRLADLLETRPLDEVAELVIEEESAAGNFDAFPSTRDLRRAAILRMNADGVPNAIRGCIDDPPLRDEGRIREVVAPSLVIGQEGDPIHRADVARELAGLLPNADLVVFPDPFALVRDIPALVARAGALLSG